MDRAALTAIVGTAAGVAAPAPAQTFVDLFAGRSLPERAPATIIADEARINGAIVPATLRVRVESLDPTDLTIYGFRAGHWFDGFGVALDASTLDPDDRRQTIRATASLKPRDREPEIAVARRSGPRSIEATRDRRPTRPPPSAPSRHPPSGCLRPSCR